MNETPTTTNATIATHENESASEAVVSAVADEEGISPTDVRPPLYAAVDPDALDELVASMARMSGESGGRVTFQYCEYEVGVSADGEVSIAETRGRDSQETTDVPRTSGEERTHSDSNSR